MSEGSSTIEEIKSRLDLVEIVSRYVQLRQAGERWTGVCPFHQETKGSFSVNPQQGFFYCFGCQAGGDVLEFYRRINGLEFREALEQLAEEAGVSLDSGGKSGKRRQGKKSLFLDMHSSAAQHFHNNLKGKKGERARGYLQARGVDSELSERFFLGWSPEDWHDLEKHLAAQGYTREQGVESGLLSRGKKGHIFDRFRNRLIFPIVSLSGHCVAFGGRVLDGGEPKYLNSSDSEIYSKGEHLYGLYQARKNVTQSKEVLLTEGYVDVLTLHQFGFSNACGVLGTALTPRQVKRLAGLARFVYLAFDGDRAGRQAAMRSVEMVLGQGMECRVLNLPDGEDVDSLLHASGKEALEKIKKNSSEGLDFCLQEINRNYSPRETLQWAKDFLSGLEDVSWRAYYIPRFARELGLAEKEFREAIEAADKKTAPGPKNTGQREGRGGGSVIRDREVLGLLICFPDLRKELEDHGLEQCLSNSWAFSFWQKIKEKTEEEFLPFLDAEERSFYYRNRQFAQQQVPQKEILRKQLHDFLRAKKRRTSREYLLKALSKAEKEGDREEVMRLLRLLQNDVQGE